MAAIILRRQRIGKTKTSEDEPLLFREVGDVVNKAQRLGMSATAQKAGLEKLSRLARCDWAVADAAGSRFHFDKRPEPKDAARSGADKLNVEATAAGLLVYCVCDKVRANGERRRICGHENADAHWVLPCAAATIESIRSRSSRPTGAPSRKAAGERAQLPRQ